MKYKYGKSTICHENESQSMQNIPTMALNSNPLKRRNSTIRRRKISRDIITLNGRNLSMLLLIAIQSAFLVDGNEDDGNSIGSEASTTIRLHPVILGASIIAAVSIVVLCIAIFIAYVKGKERYRAQLEAMKRREESPRRLKTPERQPQLKKLESADEESRLPLPTPSQLDDQSSISLSAYDSKSYMLPMDSMSMASQESYSYSLDASIANSSTVYGY